MNIKVGDRVRIIANTPHKIGTETISLRGYTGVVKAVERYGDRVIVAVEKVSTRSLAGKWFDVALRDASRSRGAASATMRRGR
jgi:ribosomal protein L21E